MAGRVFEDPPVLCGHRGMGKGVVGGLAENTLASCKGAIEAGLRWVEVDVRTTKDDVLVAAHYPTLDDGRFYADVRSDEIDGSGLLRIADLLDELPTDIAVDLDIKSSLEDALRPRDATTAALLGRLARRELTRRRVLVTSFDPAALLIAQEEAPEAAFGLLTWVRFPLRKSIPAARHLGLDVVAAHVGSFSVNDTDSAPVHREAEWSVRVAHEAGLEVAAWCPTAEQVPAMVEAGVDCLVVNEVPAAVAALAATQPS
jgi:glycerophosphoryl diester phosphodiesterase